MKTKTSPAPKIDTLTEPPVVGQVYLVPSYRAALDIAPGNMTIRTRRNQLPHIPVLGPIHDDRLPGLKFDDGVNAHVDHRFTDIFQHAIIEQWLDEETFDYRPFTCITSGFAENRPDYTSVHGRLAFQKLCEHKLVDSCKRCPHQGTYLGNVQPDRNGVVTCPAHGLRFDAEHGNLVPMKREL